MEAKEGESNGKRGLFSGFICKSDFNDARTVHIIHYPPSVLPFLSNAVNPGKAQTRPKTPSNPQKCAKCLKTGTVYAILLADGREVRERGSLYPSDLLYIKIGYDLLMASS